MATFISIHRNEYGTDIRLIRVPDNIPLDEHFYSLDEGGQVEMADKLGINHEPEKGETLDIKYHDIERVHEFTGEELGIEPDGE